MNVEEFKVADMDIRKNISRQLNLEISNLKDKFAADNALASYGDIVTDGCNIIIVDSFRFSQGIFGSGEPSVAYRGKELTKKLKPRADKATSTVFQARHDFKILNIK